MDAQEFVNRPDVIFEPLSPGRYGAYYSPSRIPALFLTAADERKLLGSTPLTESKNSGLDLPPPEEWTSEMKRTFQLRLIKPDKLKSYLLERQFRPISAKTVRESIEKASGGFPPGIVQPVRDALAVVDWAEKNYEKDGFKIDVPQDILDWIGVCQES